MTIAVASAKPTETPAITAMTHDTGTPNDFITADGTSSRTVTGTISATLQSHEIVQVSFDGGTTWNNATVSGTTWSVTDSTAHNANWTYQVRIENTQSTVSGPVVSQNVTLLNSAPSAPTVAAETTSSTIPTITGSWDNSSGNSLTVTINGHTYSTGDGSLTVNGGTWSLNIPASAGLAPGKTYDVTATTRDSNGHSTSDGSSNELQVTAAVAPPPPPLAPQAPIPPLLSPGPSSIPPPPPSAPPVLPPLVVVEPPQFTSVVPVPAAPALATASPAGVTMTFPDSGTQTAQQLQVNVSNSTSSASGANVNSRTEVQQFQVLAKDMGDGAGSVQVQVQAGLPKWLRVDTQDSGILKLVGERPSNDTASYQVMVKIRRANGEEATVILQVKPAGKQPQADNSPLRTERHATADWLSRFAAAFEAQESAPDASADASPLGPAEGLVGQLNAQAIERSVRAASLAA